MKREKFGRRCFLQRAGGAIAAGCGLGVAARGESGQDRSVKIGIRAASLKMVGDLNVIRTAAQIPGIAGVELQVTAGKPNLRDWETVRQYKREADRWGIRIPSLAGVWDRGVSIKSPAAAENVRLSIRAAEMLGSHVLLLASFGEQAPDLAREESYGPVVTMLRQVAQTAEDAGVALGLENSLSPTENAKLVGFVGHRAVGVYYDLYNMVTYNHGEEAVPGIQLLGKQRICAVHVKNGGKLIEEPGPIDWAAAFQSFNGILYDGWFVYETSHRNLETCIEETRKNNLFLQKHAKVPAG